MNRAKYKTRFPISAPQAFRAGELTGIDATDLQLVDLLRWGVEDIGRIWGVSAGRLNQMSGGGAGVRTQALQDQLRDFEATCIGPIAKIVDAGVYQRHC